MSLELKRCPFCGGEAEVREVSEGEQVYYAECTECNIRTPLEYDRKMAKADWNARVTSLKLSGIVRTVKQAFMELIDDADEGKYKNYTQAALIHECYGKAILAITNSCIQYEKRGK